MLFVLSITRRGVLEYYELSTCLILEQHKKNVRKQREVEKHSMKNSQPSTVKAKKEEDSDTDLWSRLDALEKEEAERGELER